MTKKTQPRKRHSAKFKAEALQLANTVGVAEVGKKLGLHTSQIYQ